MNLKLLNWTSSLTFDNKWERLAFNNSNTRVIAWIWTQNNKFNANILNIDVSGNMLDGEYINFEGGFSSFDEAKQFADAQLKKQGFAV